VVIISIVGGVVLARAIPSQGKMPMRAIQRYFLGLSRNTFLLAFSSLFADISTEMLYPVLPVLLTQTLNASGSIVGLVDGVARPRRILCRAFQAPCRTDCKSENLSRWPDIYWRQSPRSTCSNPAGRAAMRALLVGISGHMLKDKIMARSAVRFVVGAVDGPLEADDARKERGSSN
jgi:hypothetical protein